MAQKRNTKEGMTIFGKKWLWFCRISGGSEHYVKSVDSLSVNELLNVLKLTSWDPK